MAKNMPGRVVTTPPTTGVRLFWKLAGALARPFRFLETFFRVREQVGTATKLAMSGAFLVVCFLLWCVLTDLPGWMKDLVIAVDSDYALKEGTEVELDLDPQQGLMFAVNSLTGRRGKGLNIPGLSPGGFPELRPEAYTGLEALAAAKVLGIGGFVDLPGDTIEARISDATAAYRAGIGPRGTSLAIEPGEEVVFWLKSKTEMLIKLKRLLPGRDWRISIPEADQLSPERPLSYKRYSRLLDALADSVGVQPGRFEPEPIGNTGRGSTYKLLGVVADPEKTAAKGLGPSSPQAQIQPNERVLLVLDRADGALKIFLAREDPGRVLSIPVDQKLVDPAALPPLSPEAYPGLNALLARGGLAFASSTDGAPRAVISSVGGAESLGLGLYRPAEIRLVSQVTLASPTEILDAFGPFLWDGTQHNTDAWETMSFSEKSEDFFQNSLLIEHTLATVLRIFIGFLLGVMVSLPLGVLMGAFGKTRYYWEPWHLLLLYLPLPAVTAPMANIFGTGETFARGFLAIAASVVVLPYTLSCINQVPDVYVDTGRTLGATRAQIVRRVLVGTALADIFAGLKLGFAVCFTWVLIAETFGLDKGLGYLLQLFLKRGLVPRMYILLFIIFMLAFAFNYLWDKLIWALFPHKREK